MATPKPARTGESVPVPEWPPASLRQQMIASEAALRMDCLRLAYDLIGLSHPSSHEILDLAGLFVAFVFEEPARG